jgi:hypothetical protein
MEEVRWDREQFVQQQPRKQNWGPSIFGLLLFVITMGVLAGGGYWFLKSRGYAARLPEIKLPAVIAGPSDTEQKLDQLDLRLAQIEKRLGITPSESQSGGPSTVRRSPTPTHSTAVARVSPPTATPLTIPPPSVGTTVQATDESSEDTMQHEAWEATADRLGMAVGELGEQRREISRTRETVEAIRQQLERSSISFQVRRDGGRQTVGPIAIDLQSTDTRNQRYSLRLYFDDRAVQMKDRALGERVSFYVGGLDEPLELVVSEIAPNMVFGKLAVPPSSAPRSQMSTQ